VVGFNFSPDGRRIVVGIAGPQSERPLGLRQVAVFDTGTGERISTIEAETLAAPNGIPPVAINGGLAWSLDGSRLAFAEFGGSRIHLIEVTTGKRVQTLEASNRGGSIQAGAGGSQLTFSPDGRRIACVVSQRVDRPQTVNVLDTDSGRQVLSLPLPPSFIRSSGGTLRFSPDGHRLIHFGLVSAFSSGPPGPAVPGSRVQVTTWDATPRPEAKQP
jgi:Tol biopolymer transport system component